MKLVGIPGGSSGGDEIDVTLANIGICIRTPATKYAV